ncbi:hypothetical protein QE400_000023 [Xanthomonas sacchari]|uniref:hypothetical protein n=1 Tax=Xanthomonas sacchari TaxID=56458 RepID=UPI00277FA507|nr:hypothetical protein [Xanthomonas sacchari]MDQ1090610.1 hypothetical protein [Xanthomonas sacchari]
MTEKSEKNVRGDAGAPSEAPARRGAFASIVRVARIVYVGDLSEIRRTHAYFRDRLARVWNQGRGARKETFQEASDRLGLTAQDIERRASELRSQSVLYLGIAALAFVVFMLLPFVRNPFSHATMSLLVMLLALSKYSVSRWRQAQCEQRTLVAYVAYWSRWWRS